MPKKTPHLIAKGSRFYFRMRVPQDLVQHVGKSEITQALGDVNKGQAEVAASQLAGQWAAHFLEEKHRLGLAGSPPAPPMRAALPVRTAKPEEIRALAQLAGHSMSVSDLEGRIVGDEPIDEAPEFGIGPPLDEALKAAISGRDLSGIKGQAEDWLASHGLALPQDPLELRRALMAWAGQMSKASDHAR